MTNNEIRNELAGISSDLKQLLCRLLCIEIDVEATYSDEEKMHYTNVTDGIDYHIRRAAEFAVKAEQEYSLPF